MNLQRLLCDCHKCGQFAQPFALWLTDQGQLCVTAHCVNCEEKTNVLFPLNELVKLCPIPEQVDEPPKPFKLTADDKKFMQSMKIRFTTP